MNRFRYWLIDEIDRLIECAAYKQNVRALERAMVPGESANQHRLALLIEHKRRWGKWASGYLFQ